ncbi:O-antigen ligase [Marinobacterium sp. xm-a-152]|uniref:O-antigen ligase family protein n=1 Tax=Marinobacterium sp. xm-a-152 TaxID=2497733 RepID=UPI0015698DE8|nr:O-antigen ligase family protein [Marinobacterium sp. xm-a-152]NRP15021.1 O-Antigen ligase [Marinobacterium sp. xm-a-152]
MNIPVNGAMPVTKMIYVLVILAGFFSYVTVSYRMYIMIISVLALLAALIASNGKVNITRNYLSLVYIWMIAITFSRVVGNQSSLVSVILDVIYPITFILVLSFAGTLYEKSKFTDMSRFPLAIAILHLIFGILSVTGFTPENFAYTSRKVPFIDINTTQGLMFNVNYFFPVQFMLVILSMAMRMRFFGFISKRFFYACVLVLILSLIGFSRGGVIALVATILVGFILYNGANRFRVRFYLLLFLIIAASLLVFYIDFNEAIYKLKFAFRLVEERGDFLNSRGLLWDNALNLLYYHPLGFGDYASTEYAVGILSGYDDSKSLENTFLLQLVSSGYAGLISYLMLILYPLYIGLVKLRDKGNINRDFYFICYLGYVFYIVASIPRVLTIGGLGLITVLAGILIGFLVVKNEK